jgi:hypothetical protein
MRDVKPRRDRQEEIASNRLGVAPDENRPALIGSARTRRRHFQILSDHPRGDVDAEFDRELAGDADLAAVLDCRDSGPILFRFLGGGGRPVFRDFHRQNIRNAVRCHLMNVSGFTTQSTFRQSKYAPLRGWQAS